MTSASSLNFDSCWTVNDDEKGTALLSFLLLRLAPISAKSIKRALERGCCLVNGKREGFAQYRLWRGDVVSWSSAERLSLPPPHFLYEDECLVALDKPSGLLCDIQAINDYCTLPNPLQLVHRLDRETSGLLLLTKTPSATSSLLQQFRGRTITKSYLAITSSPPHPRYGTTTNSLVRASENHWRIGQGKGALYAETSWKCLAISSPASLVACYPKTGRTHQIRIHLASLGAPIAGDKRYGTHPLPAARCMLHAYELSFLHPMNQKRLSLRCAPPNDWKHFWETFGGSCDALPYH